MEEEEGDTPFGWSPSGLLLGTPKPGEVFGSIPCPPAAPAKPRSCGYQTKREKSSSFPSPCKAPPGMAEPAWQEPAWGGAARRRNPSRPPAFASSSPKTCLGQPLSICRAAPLAPHLLFRQTFPPVSRPAALVFSSNLLLLLPPSNPAEHLHSHALPLPDTARAGGAATSTRFFSCKTRIWRHDAQTPG